MGEKTESVAVVIPCYDEEATIGKVIDEFREELPDAKIVVINNCSSDRTETVAKEHGAIVVNEPRQGKGFAVECMFDVVDADCCVMVDGDDTYPADRVHDLLGPVIAGHADMVVGARLSEYTDEAFRPLHVVGNNMIRGLVNWVAGAKLTDILSGYRAVSRRLVRRLPVVSAGFEVETEMTIQALYYRLKIVEVKVPYKERQGNRI